MDNESIDETFNRLASNAPANIHSENITHIKEALRNIALQSFNDGAESMREKIAQFFATAPGNSKELEDIYKAISEIVQSQLLPSNPLG